MAHSLSACWKSLKTGTPHVPARVFCVWIPVVRTLAIMTLAVTVLTGCAAVPTQAPSLSVAAYEEGNLNPLFVQTDNPYYLWEALVDVLDNYFPVLHERPIRTLNTRNEDGSVLVTRTEGRIDTEPVVAAGVLQPWKKNSVNLCQRVEATFQSIRRKAVVRVVPVEKGFSIHLAIYNELENLPNPMNAGMTGTNLTFSESLNQLELPTGESAASDGWIPNGRNTELEQYILQELAWRLNNPPDVANPTGSQTAPAAKIVP